MIVTQQKRIPWWWVFMMALPPLANQFVEHCSGAPLTFTLRKFISNPALIVFLTSINIAFNFMVAPFIAYQSDRIWTRFGRRKPFIVVGWIGLVASLILTPLAPNIWALAIIVIAYQFFEDIAFTGPWTPLYYEVVPLPQRGRAAALGAFFGTCVGLYFNFFLIEHFDNVRYFALDLGFLGWPAIGIKGEKLIYWMAAAMITIGIFHVSFNIKELPAHSSQMGKRFSMIDFLKSTFGQKQWLIIYVLIFSQISMNQGLGALNNLLMTEQFGYSKKALGEIGGVTLLVKILVVVPLAGYLADKVDRLRMFQVGLFLSTLHPLAYWIFIKFIAANQVPSFQAIVSFNVFNNFVDVAGNIALAPLFFDYVPRDRMGTVYAGMTFVRGMVKLTVQNGVGVFVTVYSFLMLPPKTYDYTSGFLYLFVIGVLGCATSVYFAKERKKGEIIEYGKIELEAPGGGKG